MAGVLRSSLEVTNAYYVSAKKRNYHFAYKISTHLPRSGTPRVLKRALDGFQKEYRLDAVEYYPSLLAAPIQAVSSRGNIPAIPELSLELKRKGIRKGVEASTIHHFGDGNLVRVIVPAKFGKNRGAVVVSTFIPLSLIAKMDDIAAAYEDFREKDTLSYPLKSIYLIILVLMTLVILLGATWIGFYLAKQLSIPLVRLGQATKQVALGEFKNVDLTTGTPEFNDLIGNFNLMVHALAQSEGNLSKANTDLRLTLSQLNEGKKYIEIVLSVANTGVISLDKRGCITMVNRYAAHLLDIEAENYLGKTAKELLSRHQFLMFFEMLKNLKTYHGKSLQKDIEVVVRGRIVPLQVSLSLLSDDEGADIGRVLVFNDLTSVQNTQRAQAWKEVAQRIAHEVKNPLTPISLSAQRLQKKFGSQVEDPAFRECTEMIIDQVEGLKILVNEFGQFARLPKAQPVQSDLNDNLANVMSLFKIAHKEISFKFQADRDLPKFFFDPEQIKRVVTNLLDNAVAAVQDTMAPSIEIWVDFDNVRKLVRIAFKDNGPGIPREMQGRVFQPYMTSKPNGTGLGLAIVRRTIEDHSGTIRVFDNEGAGTVFQVTLPVRLYVDASFEKGSYGEHV